MFHLFQTYVAEVFHVATLASVGSRHAEAVPTCAASEAGVGRSPPAYASIGMWCAAACVRARCADAVACGGGCVGATIACGAATASRTDTGVWTGLAFRTLATPPEK